MLFLYQMWNSMFVINSHTFSYSFSITNFGPNKMVLFFCIFKYLTVILTLCIESKANFILKY